MVIIIGALKCCAAFSDLDRSSAVLLAPWSFSNLLSPQRRLWPIASAICWQHIKWNYAQLLLNELYWGTIYIQQMSPIWSIRFSGPTLTTIIILMGNISFHHHTKFSASLSSQSLLPIPDPQQSLTWFPLLLFCLF